MFFGIFESIVSVPHLFLVNPIWAGFVVFCLFERSEFLIATCKKKKTDRLCVWMSGCSVVI